MKKIMFVVMLFLPLFPIQTLAVFNVRQGGTGSTTPSGILYGDNGATSHLNTVTIGSNLTFTGGILSATGSGEIFPFTPTFYGNATSTTLGFLNGFLSTASSTITSDLHVDGTITENGISLIPYTGAVGTIDLSGINALTVGGNININTNSQLIFYDPNNNNFHDLEIGANGDGVLQFFRSNGNSFMELNFTSVNDQTFTFPNFSGTLGLLEATQTWTGINKFSIGSSATTTVEFGKMGDLTSRACFNTKNTEGGDISFYFVDTTMVVENNICK